MPIENVNCGECGNRHDVCPNCGSRMVTPCDNPGQYKPNHIVYYGGRDEISYTHICWDCGWEERVTVTFDREQL